jgi:uncharacterized membrane protein YheB (UPF0754 family)
MEELEEKNIIKDRSKAYAGQLWKLVNEHIELKANSDPRIVSHEAPPKKESRFKWLIKLLFIFPIFLIIGFIASFFWDFNGMKTIIFGYTITFEGLLRMLTISGMIGYLTNWIAIKMLFRPTHRRPILGQGLIPAQKDRIAYRLARAVSEDLINPEIIKKKIHDSQAIAKYREKATNYVKSVIDDPAFRDELKILVTAYVDEMIAEPEVRASIAKAVINQIEGAIEQNSFERVALKAYSFLKGQEMQDLIEDALTKLPGGVEKGLDKLDDFLDSLPDRIDQNSSTIEDTVTSLLYKLINQLDVHALVEDNLREYDEKKLEMLIKNASNDQLRFIQYLGAVLGTFGGFIIWQPIGSLLVISLILVLVVSVDAGLHALRKKNATD